MPEENKLLKAASWYASHGIAVIPLHNIVDGRCSCGKEDCGSPGKHPRTKTGLKEASKDHRQIAAWWKKWPDANIGMITGQVSGFIAIDVDGEEGRASLEELETQNGRLPDTWEQLTGGGGRHLLFLRPDMESVGNRVRIAPGLDIRADDGYIVASPSNHISGRAYVWEIAHQPNELRMAELPPWWLDLIKAPPRSAATELPEQIHQGERNNQLFKLAAALRAKSLSEAAIMAALREENQARCNPPLPDREVEGIARSACRYKPGEIRDVIRAGKLEETFGPAAGLPKISADRAPKLRSFGERGYCGGFP